MAKNGQKCSKMAKKWPKTAKNVKNANKMPENEKMVHNACESSAGHFAAFEGVEGRFVEENPSGNICRIIK